MIPHPFEYEAPQNVQEAIRLLKRHGDEAKVLAGGQSLIPLMKLRLASPRVIVDINRIPGLAYVREADGFLSVGAMTRTANLESSDLIRRYFPIISDAASQIADPLVRNVGTIGGNIAHGDPANDLPAVMLALNAQFVIEGENKRRVLPARGFYKDTFVTALGQSDLLTEIRVPIPRGLSGGSYLKLEKRVGDFAIVGVAAQLTFGPGWKVTEAGLGLTAAGPTALLPEVAMANLVGKTIDDKSIEETSELVARVVRPVTDLRGSVEYKIAMAKVLTKRALRLSRQRAKAQGGVTGR